MKKIMESTKRKKVNFFERNPVQTGMLITFENDLEEEPAGKIFNVHIPYGIDYRGYGELFIKMERIYDLLGRPQAEFQMRRWNGFDWKGTQLENTEDWDFEDSCYQDFKDRHTASKRWIYAETMFRRHGSWQGMMQAPRIGMMYYRSSLELLRYMEEYLNGCKKRTKRKTAYMKKGEHEYE